MAKKCTVLRELPEVHVAPLDKPRRDPMQRASKMPISLISVAMEILEAVIYNRVARAIAPILHPSQYAFRRSRGRDMHLALLTDFVAEHLQGGRFVYIASLDIDGASDAAPHDGLMASLWETGADAYLVSFIGTWLRGRRFKTRLLAPWGRFFSRARGVSRGLPQSGVLSPLLRLVHPNKFFEQMGSPPGISRCPDWGGASMRNLPNICGRRDHCLRAWTGGRIGEAGEHGGCAGGSRSEGAAPGTRQEQVQKYGDVPWGAGRNCV